MIDYQQNLRQTLGTKRTAGAAFRRTFLVAASAMSFVASTFAAVPGAVQPAFAESGKVVGKQPSARKAAGSPRRIARPVKVNAVTALLAKGAALHKEGRVEEAEAIFREVLSRDPRSVDAFYDLGAIAEGRGDLVGALGNYRAALALRSGDKELIDAVNSTEAAIKKGAASNRHDHPEARQEAQKELRKNSPMGLNPTAPAAEQSLSTAGSTVPEAPAALQTAESGETAAPVEKASYIPDVDNEVNWSDRINAPPTFSVPQAEAEPKALGDRTFSLSSRKGALVAPTVGVPLNSDDVPRLGVTPDQFPEPPMLKSSTKTNACPPPPVVGKAQTNHAALRRGASIMLMVGASAVLGGAMHCPICHMMRGF